MSWDARQRRLKDVLGTQNNFCFQVFAMIYQPQITDAEEASEFLYRHNINARNNSIGYLPRHKFGAFEVDAGWYSIKENVLKVAPIFATKLYSLAPYNAHPSEVKEKAEESLKTIREKYISEIESQYLDLKSNELGHIIGRTDGRNVVKFVYSLQPYTPSLCHPRDLGVLQPITLCNDSIIHPSILSIVDCKTLRKHSEKSEITCKPFNQ